MVAEIAQELLFLVAAALAEKNSVARKVDRSERDVAIGAFRGWWERGFGRGNGCWPGG